MINPSFLFPAVLISLAVGSIASPVTGSKHSQPPAFFLAGDSTTAVQSTNGGGWGDGFLNTTLKHGATGKNFGHNGATTVSFRAGGDWDNVIQAAKASLPSYKPYVTIQFGHNDQKPDKNISMADLTANLITFVKEVRSIPATPVLVTSLSRRRFTNSSTPTVVENLADVVAATKDAAKQTGAYIIDLNAASTKYLNQIGPENAATYNLIPTDFTHLNAEGSVVFGNLVALLLDREVRALGKFVVPEKEIVKAIKTGTYYFPS
ncbi:carbohydrate esterase family 12 protein [Aaosphaeria arxii CBS 175.79]|uniref:Carbohydrate esterase family 12 protein n=1 Tax=Aaosphaeria arxii CBS 175.79 TaxID=1450172 RepID=A0A6A5XYK9_9PLEO|nr:carbohydrate esterase family 12 protein [Aaosphaeria arxii CBS 175.79]KAF2017907.1 carbohydrate esterase family 12 protein [Aaosphaeria arxii CBS 175.79]